MTTYPNSRRSIPSFLPESCAVISALVVPDFGVGEGAEFGGVFAGHDVGAGIEAGLEGVGTGGGLALGGARARGLLGVAAVGGDLAGDAHTEEIAGEGAGV